MNADIFETIRHEGTATRTLVKSIVLVFVLFCCGAKISFAAQEEAQIDVPPQPNETGALIVEGEQTKDVFGMGQSVIVRGRVTHGVIAFGGDVIVEGRVEGDVAAVGGSVMQRDGSYIGGDVWVFGGAYHHGKSAPGRNANSATVMYAGYEQELREMARHPASLLEPSWTPFFFGWRLLSILFWFVLSWTLTAITPGAVSRAAARLQLTSLHVAVIGFLGAVVMALGLPASSLWLLPPTLGVIVGAMVSVLLLLAYLFGRVVIHAATGRWLQRLLLSEEKRSESVALLLGASLWAVILSVPYIWPLIVAGLFVMSLGLALTARYRISWKTGAKG